MPNAGHKWRFVGSFGQAGGKTGIPFQLMCVDEGS